jgi:uncharacterized protein (DUF58 family)
VAGDDIRRVDLAAVCQDRPWLVKQYEADTNAIFLSCSTRPVDGVCQSGRVEAGVRKFLAACLAYLSHRQRDRVGIVTFDEDVVAHVPSSAKHFNVLLHTLDRAKAERPGRLLPMLTKMAEHFKRRSIVALISDLYENPEDLMEALKPYSFLGNDLVVFHVLDPAEIDFPYRDASRFQDLESGEEIPVVPDSFADQYRKMIRDHIESIRTKCSESRIDYVLLNTSKPLDEALFSYLGNRERLMRVR